MEDIVVRPDIRIPAHELEESTSRSGGAGGQHVNKVSTRVQLRWNVRESTALHDRERLRLLAKLRLTNDGDLLIVVDEHKSQLQNRMEAREKLAEVVRDALFVPKKRVATKPGRAAKKRRVDDKKRASVTKTSRKKASVDD